jgi:hypothetical protein
MNSLTLNWNASTLYNERTFECVASGTQITVPANRPVDVRAFLDAVAAGAYTEVV